MSAQSWQRRRRRSRLWREIRRGLPVVMRDPEAVVPLPEGLCLISYPRYERLTSMERG